MRGLTRYWLSVLACFFERLEAVTRHTAFGKHRQVRSVGDGFSESFDEAIDVAVDVAKFDIHLHARNLHNVFFRNDFVWQDWWVSLLGKLVLSRPGTRSTRTLERRSHSSAIENNGFNEDSVPMRSLLILLMMTGLETCGAADRPNILLCISDDQSYPYASAYGTQGITTPAFDQVANEGVLFNNAYAASPGCSPSRAALWTGRFPHANGVVGLTHSGFANDLNPDEKHLAEILREAGYDTHLFGGQHEARTPERCGHEQLHGGGRCGTIAAEFGEWLISRSDSNRPIFAQVNFFEPHRPFPHGDVEALSRDGLTVPPYLPDIPEVREDLAEIEASIASADRAFGRIVEAIESSCIADNTVIVFTADHGIAFPHAKMTLYDPGIEVPLLINGPGITPETVRHELISNVDVMPTLLELASLPLPSNLQGRSFASLLANKPYTPNETVFAEKTYHTYYDPMRAVRNNRWKLIANFEFAPWQETSPDYKNNAKSYVEISNALDVPCDIQYHPPLELYDLEDDPYEQHNLADDPAVQATRDELIQELYRWMQRTGDPLLNGPMAQGAYRQRMKRFKDIGQQGAEGDG